MGPSHGENGLIQDLLIKMDWAFRSFSTIPSLIKVAHLVMKDCLLKKRLNWANPLDFLKIKKGKYSVFARLLGKV